MASATRTQKGFNVRCPKCGAEDSLRIDVDDVSVLTCRECDDETSPDDIKDVIGQWTKLLAWLGTAPDYEG